jgi:hypothetical protein
MRRGGVCAEDVQEHVVKMGLGDTLADLAGHLDQVYESEHTCLIGCLLCLASNRTSYSLLHKYKYNK